VGGVDGLHVDPIPPSFLPYPPPPRGLLIQRRKASATLFYEFDYRRLLLSPFEIPFSFLFSILSLVVANKVQAGIVGGCRTHRLVHSYPSVGVRVSVSQKAQRHRTDSLSLSSFSFWPFSVSIDIFRRYFPGPADRRLYHRAVYRLGCYRAFQLSAAVSLSPTPTVGCRLDTARKRNCAVPAERPACVAVRCSVDGTQQRSDAIPIRIPFFKRLSLSYFFLSFFPLVGCDCDCVLAVIVCF
jgi:hypothetical protein